MQLGAIPMPLFSIPIRGIAFPLLFTFFLFNSIAHHLKAAALPFLAYPLLISAIPSLFHAIP